MDKLQVPEMDEAAYAEARKLLSEQLKKDEAVIAALRERDIPLQEIELHPFRISRWLEEKKKCLGCKGLTSCTQRQKGYAEELYFDGILQTGLEACGYLQKKNKAEAHLGQYLICDLPPEMHTVSFAGIDPSKENGRYVSALMEVMRACDGREGIYLYGNMGTGKTYLAACAANSFARQGLSVAFVHCPKMVERILSGYKTNEHLTEISRLGYADVAVFDDIGAEDVTDRVRSILLSILDERMQNHRITWFTSNEDHASLLEHYTSTSRGDDVTEAKRILERIRTLARPVSLIGKDRRTLYSTED